MHLGRSFHSTEPPYLKLFSPYVIVLNYGASTFIFCKSCPVSLIGSGLIMSYRYDGHCLPGLLLAKYFIHFQCYLSHSIELEGD